MRQETGHCTIEQGRQLHELGIEQRGHCCYAFPIINSHPSFDGEVTEYIPEYSDEPEFFETSRAMWDGLPFVCVFSVAELGQMMPGDYYATFWAYEKWFWVDLRNEDPRRVAGAGRPDPLRPGHATEAEARADLLIWALKAERITAEVINKKLLAS